MNGMKTKDEKDLFRDDIDRMLAERLSPLRETAVPDDGFSQKVMDALPRRDISLWVILLAVGAGLAVAIGIMGWQQAVEFYRAFVDFFTSLFQREVPSMTSQVSFVAVLAVLGFAFYAFLDTDDYQNADRAD